jgi:hypothetical protein
MTVLCLKLTIALNLSVLGTSPGPALNGISIQMVSVSFCLVSLLLIHFTDAKKRVWRENSHLR